MIDEHEIFVVRKKRHIRKSWVCSDGKLGTVEEIAREYYLQERGFRDCLIESACVYGGLAWLLFHGILFHDNLNSRQPLCTQYLHTPQRFYKKHKYVIESSLSEYKSDRCKVFDRQLQRYQAHPFFCDPNSNIAKHHGAWLRKNIGPLRSYIESSAEHDQESLVREILLSGNKGRNSGWPDLVAWSEDSLVFAEVKSTDCLSDAQQLWIADHQGRFKVELVRVVERE